MSYYVREVDVDRLRGCDSRCEQLLWASESCLWQAVGLAAGTPDRGLRTYPTDHVYFVLDGELTVTIEDRELRAGPETTVLVPARAPHSCANRGSAPELHLELLLPGPAPGRAVSRRSAARRSRGIEPLVRRVAEVEVDPKVEIFDRRLLLTPTDGCEHGLFYEATLEPGDRGMGLHVHSSVDQFYYVLEGELTCQIGVEQHTLGPHTLAAMPRQLPHDPWNESNAPERHLSLVAPGAVPNQAGAHIPVTLNRN